MGLKPKEENLGLFFRLFSLMRSLRQQAGKETAQTIVRRDILFLPMRQSSIFNCAGKFRLAHGLRQLTREAKSDVS